jgi:hypothetical protein
VAYGQPADAPLCEPSQDGWAVVVVFDDNAVSGGVPRKDRPAMKALRCAVVRREIDMVVAGRRK